jgi:hypothetical protein
MLEASGVQYESEEDRQARFAWNKQQQEIEDLKVANL